MALMPLISKSTHNSSKLPIKPSISPNFNQSPALIQAVWTFIYNISRIASNKLLIRSPNSTSSPLTATTWHTSRVKPMPTKRFLRGSPNNQ